MSKYSTSIPCLSKREMIFKVIFVNYLSSLLPDLYLIPDGAVTFHNASEKFLNYTVQVNDIRIHEYHRNNGVTKISYKNSLNPNMKHTMLMVAEGQLSVIDLVSRAYLHYLN